MMIETSANDLKSVDFVDRLSNPQKLIILLKQQIKSISNELIRTILQTFLSKFENAQFKDENDFFNFFETTVRKITSEPFFETLSTTHVHNFVDSNTLLFFPNYTATTDSPSKLQRALILKSWLNLNSDNLEEASIGFQDVIRFAQTNQDEAAVNFGIAYLSFLAHIKGNFTVEQAALKSFFASNLDGKDPVLIFFLCLANLDLDLKTSFLRSVL